MRPMTMQWILLVCVAVMAVGQILFKQVAISYNKTGSLLHPSVLGPLFVAGVLYLSSTGLWIWALRHVEISKAYPVFALGFVLVPVVGAWLYGETLSLKFALGAAFIVMGVILTGSR